MSHPVLDYVFAKNAIHSKKLKKNLASTPGMEGDLESYLARCQPFLEANSITSEDLGDAYLSMVRQMCSARFMFMKTGKYPVDSHSSAVSDVYANKKVMTQYMLGLGISQFLWKHHYGLFTFYRETIGNLANLERCLEVGSGHGLFLLELLQQHPEAKTVDVVDISTTSLELTKNLVTKLHPDALESIHFVHSDIEVYESEKTYDFITIGEVLEHVPRPKSILESLYRLLAPGGHVYMSTCANCPTIDHIYHFHDVSEIQAMLRDVGFRIVSEVVAPSEDLSPEKLEALKVDISYAAILARS